MFDKEETIKILLKGVADTTNELQIREKVQMAYNEGRVLNIKLGLDPSAADIHLGHAVALRKIRQLQELGHVATIIIGDFTGMIGDPTGKSKTRNQLSREQVLDNAKTYQEQIFKIIDKSKTIVRFNSEWFDKMSFRDVIDLCSRATVSRLLERDDFNKRYNNNQPISVHEFFYPLMQAYDSVIVESDIELGGTDQTFNILMARNIQKSYNLNQQAALFVPLLEGIDGKEKMSKSLGNYIGINEEPKVMYTKIMKIPDELIIRYFELTTDVHPDEITYLKEQLEKGSINPRDLKMRLAREIIKLYHSSEEAMLAEEYFKAIYQSQSFTEVELQTIYYYSYPSSETESYSLIDCIYTLGIYKSKSEVRRLIQQGGVKVNGIKTNDIYFVPIDGMIIQVGKGIVFRLSHMIESQAKSRKLDAPNYFSK